ncbi:MarR family winged helix-turn-helix transcriptional regulator [Solirhodobacter olei]|uniref:MarR family winged helix-turn-helix transcriptional regulator n=1 Tax=Solirhodobacter olei TaxID=2493082 RepID=UPI000FD87888|nr:MarR family transcriptional regulator [Solirhodobacter olei]
MKSERVDSFGQLVHSCQRLLRARFEAHGRSLGLSSAQWRLLVPLWKEGQATQSRLAELMEIEPISVSRLVTRMEQAGWVERRADPNDRRIRLVVPTAKTNAAFADLRNVANGVYGEAMAGMSEDDRLKLIEGLNTVVNNLSGAQAAEAEDET